ncbi:MAG: DUF805 domain-containing protein [Hyphomicrobiales bacterium]|nr:DUF805 domain-containing protein [Hyphomicrobiales bacterium]MCP4997275.1 DUF805 domain-containing protein [Hyphomicrobiales bacterium]
MLNFYFGLNGRVRRTSAFLGTVALQSLGALALYLWARHLGVSVFDDPFNRIMAPQVKPAFAVVAAVLLWSSYAVLWKRLNDVDEDLQPRFIIMKWIYPVLAALYLAVISIGGFTLGDFNADITGIPLLLVWAFLAYLPPEPGSNEFGPNPRSQVMVELEKAAYRTPLEKRMQKLQSTSEPGSRVQRVTRPAPQVSHAMSGFGKRTR